MFASRIRFASLGCACALMFGVLGSAVRARDDKPAAQDPMSQDAAAMAAMEAAGKPGPQHAQLKEHFAGEWNCQITHMWGPQPETTNGAEKVEAMFGGRFLRSSFDGTMMGQPFQGAGVTGYDNLKQQYFTTWMDSMGTSMILLQGSYDDATKTYTFKGEMPGPGGQGVPMREAIRIEGPDKHTFEMYMPGPDGKEAKVMTIVYTRKK